MKISVAKPAFKTNTAKLFEIKKSDHRHGFLGKKNKSTVSNKTEQGQNFLEINKHTVCVY